MFSYKIILNNLMVYSNSDKHTIMQTAPEDLEIKTIIINYTDPSQKKPYANPYICVLASESSVVEKPSLYY